MRGAGGKNPALTHVRRLTVSRRLPHALRRIGMTRRTRNGQKGHASTRPTRMIQSELARSGGLGLLGPPGVCRPRRARAGTPPGSPAAQDVLRMQKISDRPDQRPGCGNDRAAQANDAGTGAPATIRRSPNDRPERDGG
jgi:hypothetical protein